MIRPIDIRLNAAHPELPPPEAVTYTGSPSTVFIRGVPGNCGRWAITAVSVAATFPDGSTTTRAAVQSANGVWVATLPATATSGRTENGFRIMMDAIDENGEAATGYIVAVTDFAVASLDVTPAPQPGETSWQMLYFDAVPSVLRKGDVAKIDGVLKFYNGEAWEAFATPPTLDDAVTRTSANGVKSSGIWSAIWGALSALPTGFSSLYDWVVDKLAGKLDASNGVASGLVTYLGTFNGFDYGLRFGSFGSDYAVQIVARSAGSQIEWTATANLMVQKSKTGYAALLSDIPSVPSASTSTPLMDGTGSAGSSAAFARGDHVHPSDTSKLDKSGGGIAKIEWVNSGQSNATLLITFANGKTLAFDYDGYSSDTVATQGWIAAQNFVKSLTSYFTAGNLASLTHDGGIEDAGWTAGDLARYALTTKTISNGAVSLDDRAMNAVAFSSSLASLTVNCPTATSGKARDFGLRLTVASGITTAPQIVLPQGVTCENADGEAPEIGADGAATVLYFTETASGVFLVKGEVLQTITA